MRKSSPWVTILAVIGGIAGIGFILVLVLCAGCFNAGKNAIKEIADQESKAQSQSRMAHAKLILTKITPEQLAIDLSNESQTKVAREDTARTKLFEVTGPVFSIEDTDYHHERICVEFDANQGRFPFWPIKVTYPKELRVQVSKIKPGDVISCTGTFDETDVMGGIYLKGEKLSP